MVTRGWVERKGERGKGGLLLRIDVEADTMLFGGILNVLIHPCRTEAILELREHVR